MGRESSGPPAGTTHSSPLVPRVPVLARESLEPPLGCLRPNGCGCALEDGPRARPVSPLHVGCASLRSAAGPGRVAALPRVLGPAWGSRLPGRCCNALAYFVTYKWLRRGVVNPTPTLSDNCRARAAAEDCTPMSTGVAVAAHYVQNKNFVPDQMPEHCSQTEAGDTTLGKLDCISWNRRCDLLGHSCSPQL